jgi:23S rRNA (cytidine1920-2'-O)/16S rRNA (cytidine1409-2'-O)-methyltransferase
MATERLDVLLVRRGFFPSREKAQRAIMAGEVILPSRPSVKAGDRVDPDVDVEVRVRDRYVGRGGLKLEAALQHFQIDPTGKVCLDAGASTGGFTDCLLQHGAARVHAFERSAGGRAGEIQPETPAT